MNIYMSLFSSIGKAALKIATGRVIRKGVKAGVGAVTKGVKRLSPAKLGKGIKRIGQSGERVVGGVSNVGKRLNPSDLIKIGRQIGFTNLASKMKPVLRTAYQVGSNRVAKGQALKELQKIGQQTKNVRNLNELKNVLQTLKANKSADATILERLLSGTKNLMRSAKNAGVDTAKTGALDYVIGDGITKLGAGAIGLGSVAGGSALGVALSK